MTRRIVFGLCGLLLVALVAGGGWAGWIYFVRDRDPMAKAQALIASGNLRAAQVELRNAIRAQPRNAEAHLDMARLQMKLADPVAAEVEFRAARAVGADPNVVLPLLGEAMVAEGLNREVLTTLPRSGATPAVTARLLLMRSVAQLALNDVKGATDTLALIQKAAPDSVEALLIASRLAAARNDLPGTTALVDQVLAKDPTQIDALLMKEQLVTLKGDHAAGLALADRAVKSAPYSAMARMRRANQYMFKDDDAKAQEDVDAVLSVQPRFIEAVYLKALIMARAGKLQDATTEMEKLSSVAQKFPQALYYQGMLALRLGRAETAVDYAKRYNAIVPTDPEGVRLLAQGELATKRPDLAVTLLEKAIKDGQGDATTLDLLGSAYGLEGNPRRAAETLAEAAKLSPDDPSILAHYGVAQVQLGQAAAAVATLTRSMSLAAVPNPTVAEALVTAELGSNDLDKAEKDLAALRKQVGETEGVGVLSGMVRMRRNDIEGARAALTEALKKYPNSIVIRLDLARVLAASGRRSEALVIMSELLAKDPSNVPVLEAYVPMLLQDKQLPTALQALEAAHAASPSQVVSAVMLGDVLTLTGNAPKAVTMLQEVAKNGPGLEPVQAALARALLNAGKRDEAEAQYRAILAKTPGLGAERNELVRLLVQDKNIEGAMAVLRDGIAATPGNLPMMTNLVMLAGEGGLDKALAVADTLQANPANMPVASVLKGDALSRASKAKEAGAAYLAAYKVDASGPLLMRTVAAMVRAEQYYEATHLLTDWLKANPVTPDASQALAQLDIRAKRYPEAVKNLNAVLAVRPNDPLALNNLAWLYMTMGDKRARAAAQTAYLQQPTSDAADTLGWILVREGDVKAGLPLLQRAGAAQAANPTVQYHLAVALKDDGQTDAAAKILKPLVASNVAFDDQGAARALLEQVSRR